jgi:acyl-CoA synthetase (AMP-forming)/AMP-acid ligase II
MPIGADGWNYADVWDVVADLHPNAPFVIQGDRLVRWADAASRADALAGALLEAGLGHQDKVAQYLYNCPEYLESVYATLKAGLVPVNTNYRYLDDELTYIWDNADAGAVVFQGTFTDTIERIRARVPGVRL